MCGRVMRKGAVLSLPTRDPIIGAGMPWIILFSPLHKTLIELFRVESRGG